MTIIQQPLSISMTGNMLPFIINSTQLVSFTLKAGDDVLIESTYEPDSNGVITVDVAEIVAAALSYTKSGDAFYKQVHLVKEFTATVDAATVKFKAIRSGVLDLEDTPTNWLTANFLTWQPQAKAVVYYSPEWLTYYATTSCTIKLKAYFSDKAEQNVTLGSCQAGGAFTFNLQYAHIAGLLANSYPTHYDVWAENSAGDRLSFIQRYYYSEIKSEQEQWIGFENSLGGFDILRAGGDGDLNNEAEHKLAVVDGNVEEYKIDTKRIYTKNTGHLTDYERRWLMDFPHATAKYIYHRGVLRKIAVTETNFNYAVSDSPTDYSFKYRFINQSSALNLVRNEGDIPTEIVMPNISAPSFFLPPRLSELPRVELRDDTLIPAMNPHSKTPTVTTAGHIIQSAVAESLSRVPGASDGGIMVQVLTEDSELAITDRNVFSSLRTVKEIKDRLVASRDDMFTFFKTKFLRKDVDDKASGVVTFLKGALFGLFSSGIETGKGARIDADGNIEAESAMLRSFLEVPTIRYNEQQYLGETTVISAGGIIEEVTEMTSPEGEAFYRVKLKLDEGKHNYFQVNDILKGIFHQFEDLQPGELAGFQTSWFRVKSIDSNDEAYMDIIMAADSEVPGRRNFPPRKFMNIAKRGNFTDKDRQFCIELSSKTGNIVMYDGVDNYKSGIVTSQWGKPSGLEFIEGYEDLPINKDEALQYVKTLLVENIVRIDINGVVKKEITDRGAWSLATAQSDEPYLNNEEHIHEAWHKASKYRCIANMTLNEPSPTSPDWIQIFEIKGVVSDGIRMKFIDSDSKPERPVGDAPGWRNTPDKEDGQLYPVGANLYDRNYLITNGWTVEFDNVTKDINAIGGEHLVNPTNFTPNTQYQLDYDMLGDPAGSSIIVNYSTGEPTVVFFTYRKTGIITTDEGRTVESIKIGNYLMSVSDETTLYKLGDTPEPVLEPTGTNLYDRQYLLNQGWSTAAYAAVYKTGSTTSWRGNIVDSSKFQENTQYRFAQSSWYNRSSSLTVYYTDGSSQSAYENFDTQKNKTVSRFEVFINNGSYPLFEIMDDATLFALKETMGVARPVWKTQQSIVDGVPTLWSDPVRYEGQEGQGQPGETPYIGWNSNWWIGDTDTGVSAKGLTPYIGGNGNWWIGDIDTGVKAEGKDGKPGKGINLKPAVANYDALPPAPQNAIDDARVTLDTGNLWVWDGAQWNDNGPFKGQDGENGVNYLNFGDWDEEIRYRITDLGIPMVRVPIGTTQGYTVYTLKVSSSTPGRKPNTTLGLTEWTLIENMDMVFMEQAYIQKLQAQIIDTVLLNAENIVADGIKAEQIEAMNIVHPSGKYSLIDGKLKVEDAEVKGKLSVPFVIIDSFTSDSIINLDDSFNISTHSYMADKTIYLPIDEKYNGVVCHIHNGGRTQNEGSFEVKIQGNRVFEGKKRGIQIQSINIGKGQIGAFICLKDISGSIGWACTNYSDLQL